MKVLQINSVCGIRSTGRICTDIAEVLEKEGHECKIAYGRESVPEKYQKYAVRIGNNFSNYVDGIKTRLLDNAGFNSYQATKRFLSWVKEYDPDIIHLHNLHGYYIHIGLLFEYLHTCGKPVVWTLHDCWPFTGHCAYYDYTKCEKWKTGCYHCAHSSRYPKSMFLDRSKQNHERKVGLFNSVKKLQFIAISNWIADQQRASLLQKHPVTVIHNGIDLTNFAPTQSNFRQAYDIGDKRLYLGVASFWDRRKGLDTFHQLAQKLNENEVIVLVGLDDKQLKSLPSQIIGIKRTNSVKELAEIYTAADVFLNPTVEEGLGLVNIEATACGTPVVTYNTGGSPECVSDSSGIVVPKGDIIELLNAARAINLNTENIVQDAQKFDKCTKYAEYLQLYKECLM